MKNSEYYSYWLKGINFDMYFKPAQVIIFLFLAFLIMYFKGTENFWLVAIIIKLTFFAWLIILLYIDGKLFYEAFKKNKRVKIYMAIQRLIYLIILIYIIWRLNKILL
ncbi:MAG: hypothetical protein UR68_C0035G0016 [Candidatus Roizmanbacteria bacterium GW2011_GWA2_35_19]|uniref:Uncharacterized protein n=2 Tax=Candidatus Roizmaniibacteriota TaxID=1752723 RepID=A0A0G0C5P2_9BACT|nr:MAG: hypothetical protein UR63_C0037G0014 [Candidatus Roizmanbacteria bacterium GW2011_GWC2_35_12]KKP71491.1 MAG: hypothetical protein UR68_C0035G0016 [Candidatus Roizmanbacteria bacterium GW2011_GWA2_35_19]